MQWQPNKFHVYANEGQQLGVFLLDPDGTPVNISGATAIELLLKKQDGTVFCKAATTGLAWGIAHMIYVYIFDLSSEDTALLPMGQNQTLILKVHFGSVVRYITIVNALTVSAVPFLP